MISVIALISVKKGSSLFINKRNFIIFPLIDHRLICPDFYHVVLREGIQPDMGRGGFTLFTGEHPSVNVAVAVLVARARLTRARKQ